MSGAYYNDNDPYCAAWLRNLIRAGLLPAGDVDERDIRDVAPDDLKGYTAVHMFAGIGGWAYGLHLAGWPDDLPVWTGSCPCQPWSAAGRRQGVADPRHLWPEWFRLIRGVRPARVMGEQVSAAIGGGWLDGVFADLDGQGYASRALVLPACAVNAPHIRERVWFVANSARDGVMANIARGEARPARQPRERGVVAGGMADAERPERRTDAEAGHDAGRKGHWDESEWRHCGDGKLRRVKPGLRLLAHGVSGRLAVSRSFATRYAAFPEEERAVGRIGALRGFGNAIVPQIAATLAAAYLDCLEEEAA